MKLFNALLPAHGYSILHTKNATEAVALTSPRRRLFFSIVTAMVFACCLWTSAAQANNKRPFNVLILNAYHDGIPWQRSVGEGIMNELKKASAVKMKLYVEQLDKARFRETVDEVMLAKFLSKKYASRPIDLVIATAFEAVQFLKGHPNVFGAANLVFLTSSAKDVSLGGNTRSIQVPIVPNHRRALEIALQLHPNTEKVLVVGEKTKGGKLHIENVKAAVTGLDRNVEFEFFTDYSMDELLERVAHMPTGSLIYSLLIFRDNTGARFVPRQVAGWISEKANVPVYSHWETLLGSGIVGGYLIDGELAGRAAAKAGMLLLSGGEMVESEVTPADNLGYFFDWRQLQRWEIDETRLPPGSRVHFRILSEFDKYLWQILALIGFVVLQTILIVGLLISRKQRNRAMVLIADAREKAEQANRAKSDFLGNMSHELRTPLNAIIGFSGAMKSKMLGPLNEKYMEYANDINASGEHLLELINDILDVSAIEAAKLELQSENLDVGKIIEASINMVNNRATDGNIDLTCNTDDSLPMLHADRRRLSQILLNLLSNAIKFTPPDGEVSLTASLDDGGAHVFTVTDTGVGMDEEELAKAMSKFGQVESGIAKNHDGTGLGLPLTQGLVELHGGTFEIESTKGRGTTVTARFPLERTVAA